MESPTSGVPATARTPLNITTIPNLVRRLGELEVPAKGAWPLVRTSHVAIADSRPDHPIRVRIVSGAFEIDHWPELSTIRMELDGSVPMSFVGRPTSVVANRHGMSEWSIAGTLTRGGQAEPTVLKLNYHGVFRSRGRAWAWFSGSGAVDGLKSGGRWRRFCKPVRRLVVLDVLFDRPGSEGPTSLASRAAA